MVQTMVRAVGLTAGVLFLANSVMAQAKPPAPAAKKGSVYDVQFAFGDTTYSGKMTLAIVKGTVSGSMAMDTPTTVTGEVAGTLSNSKLALDYPYSMAGERPCTGRVVVQATMDAKDGGAQGTAHSSGCGDPVDGTFTLKRAAAK